MLIIATTTTVTTKEALIQQWEKLDTLLGDRKSKPLKDWFTFLFP